MQGEWDIRMDDDDDITDALFGDRDPDVPTGRDGSGTARRATIQDILSTLFEMQSSNALINPTGGQSISLGRITLQDLSRVIRRSSYIDRTYTGDDEDEDEEDSAEGGDDDDEEANYDSVRRASHQWFPEVTEPRKAGVELLMSGDFGRVGNKIRSRQNDVNIAKLINNQSSRLRQASYKEDYASNLIPNSNGTAVAVYDANIYTGQFSADSSFYYTCSQDFRLHVFDTTAPPVRDSPPGLPRPVGYYSDLSLQTNMKVRKSIRGHPGRWTITDANLSPDNERMIYSSITPTVYMTSTVDSSPAQIPIPFADPPSRVQSVWGFGESFGIYSCRFSADGNEVIAGGSGKIFVYDLLANQRTVKIAAHTDDVNSCCWADTASGNVLVSASDDTFLKVWDRRSLGASQKPSGVLVGHTEGITYVSAKGDGRYVISNGKDQSLRLWDLRKMRSNTEFEGMEHDAYRLDQFDYRYPHYPRPKYDAHPQDCSVMTYRGHSVLRTLIRCHFSPGETTGGQYLYSGSADGRIHIWSLDGRIVQVLDRARTLPMSFDPSGPEPESTSGRRSNVCVRDVSWHSQESVILSAGWESGHGGSIVARHEWKGLSKMPGALEDWVEKSTQEQRESSRRRSTRLQERANREASQHIPGAFESEGED